MLKTSILALNKNEELRLPTCKGTRGQSPGRSTGPSRWRPLWTGKAHTAAWWSGRRHWWLCETSAGENLTWKSSSLSLFTKKNDESRLENCAVYLFQSVETCGDRLCAAGRFFKQNWESAVEVFATWSKENPKDEDEPLSLVEIKMINELKVN